MLWGRHIPGLRNILLEPVSRVYLLQPGVKNCFETFGLLWEWVLKMQGTSLIPFVDRLGKEPGHLFFSVISSPAPPAPPQHL